VSEPRWFNAAGEEVDLDDIDREYALNILTMVIYRHGQSMFSTADDLRHDPLVQKLRDVVLEGREPNLRDRARAIRYNAKMRAAGLPYRAPVRSRSK
jgi:hypothetical protein